MRLVGILLDQVAIGEAIVHKPPQVSIPGPAFVEIAAYRAHQWHVQARLQALQLVLTCKNILLMIDDVWKEALPDLLGPEPQLIWQESGSLSCLLVTSRFPLAAGALALNADALQAKQTHYESVMADILLANATLSLAHNLPDVQVQVCLDVPAPCALLGLQSIACTVPRCTALQTVVLIGWAAFAITNLRVTIG